MSTAKPSPLEEELAKSTASAPAAVAAAVAANPKVVFSLPEETDHANPAVERIVEPLKPSSASVSPAAKSAPPQNQGGVVQNHLKQILEEAKARARHHLQKQQQQPRLQQNADNRNSTSEAKTIETADSVVTKKSIEYHAAAAAIEQDSPAVEAASASLPASVGDSKITQKDEIAASVAAAIAATRNSADLPAPVPPAPKRQRQQNQASRQQASLATASANLANSEATSNSSAPLPPPPPPQLSAKQRAHQRAIKSASAFNRRFLANRPAGAVCTQTLQLLLPVKPQQQQQQSLNRSAYPVAILPGQFADACQHADTIAAGRERLNYLPLTSCLYALPTRPALPPVRLETGVKCTVCNSDCSAGLALECSECHSRGHAACLQLPDNMLKAAKAYAWQCMDCKRCQECLDPGNEEQMMFCDACDRGFHTFCVGLPDIPQGHWECPVCVGPDATAAAAAAAATAAAAAAAIEATVSSISLSAAAGNKTGSGRGRKRKSLNVSVELSAKS